jgi:hypothetical protein
MAFFLGLGKAQRIEIPQSPKRHSEHMFRRGYLQLFRARVERYGDFFIVITLPNQKSCCPSPSAMLNHQDLPKGRWNTYRFLVRKVSMLWIVCCEYRTGEHAASLVVLIRPSSAP